MRRFAIMFRVRPGTEDKVRDLLANYAPPRLTTSDGTKLLSTSVFMKDNIVVRVVEIDGEISGLVRHIASDPNTQAIERELDQYLVEEDRRDASTPEKARAFFARALMEHVTTRVATEQGSTKVDAAVVNLAPPA